MLTLLLQLTFFFILFNFIFPITFYPLYALYHLHPCPSTPTMATLLSMSMSSLFSLNPFTPLQPTPSPRAVCLLSIYESVSLS